MWRGVGGAPLFRDLCSLTPNPRDHLQSFMEEAVGTRGISTEGFGGVKREENLRSLRRLEFRCLGSLDVPSHPECSEPECNESPQKGRRAEEGGRGRRAVEPSRNTHRRHRDWVLGFETLIRVSESRKSRWDLHLYLRTSEKRRPKIRQRGL